MPQDRGRSPSLASQLTIWGDYFNQDTRALLAICEMAEVQHTFELVDTFQHVNKTESYTKVNPTQSIPMISDSKWKILGDGIETYDFLVVNYP